MEQNNIIIRVAEFTDTHYAQRITDEMEASAKARGTGIAKRSPEYIAQKMLEGKAVIALTTTGQWLLLYRNMEPRQLCCQQWFNCIA